MAKIISADMIVFLRNENDVLILTIAFERPYCIIQNGQVVRVTGYSEMITL